MAFRVPRENKDIEDIVNREHSKHYCMDIIAYSCDLFAERVPEMIGYEDSTRLSWSTQVCLTPSRGCSIRPDQCKIPVLLGCLEGCLPVSLSAGTKAKHISVVSVQMD